MFEYIEICIIVWSIWLCFLKFIDRGLRKQRGNCKNISYHNTRNRQHVESILKFRKGYNITFHILIRLGMGPGSQSLILLWFEVI